MLSAPNLLYPTTMILESTDCVFMRVAGDQSMSFTTTGQPAFMTALDTLYLLILAPCAVPSHTAAELVSVTEMKVWPFQVRFERL